MENICVFDHVYLVEDGKKKCNDRKLITIMLLSLKVKG